MPKARVTHVLLAALLFGGTARAADPPIVRLEVDAPADCTTREELAARIAARSRRIGFADDAAVAVRVTVAPGPGGRSVAGALTITRPGAPAAARRITAASCEQASDGLALIIALALDPGSSDALVRLEPPAVTTPPMLHPRVVGPPPVVSAPAAPVRTGLSAEAGAEAGAEAMFGPAPRAMPGLRVGARVSRDRTGSVWSPALVLSVVHAWAGDLGEPGGTAAFTLDAANLDACPLRLAAGRWEARACGALLVGRLAATGSNTYAPASASRPFAAGGASLLLAAALGPRLVLGARLEAAASWTRDAYAFSPTVFHRSAAVTLAGGLSVGVRFR
ncbi:MAG: hypothetical protein ACJ8F1_07085 [Polyangia bacterium]